MAGVVVQVFTSASDAEHAYEMMLQIERTSWKHNHGTAITAVARQVGFYRDLIRGAAAHGRLHLQILMAGDQPVAYNLGYLHEGGYFYLKSSYAESWKALGAATYLRARLIETLIEQGLRFMDFHAHPYEWERRWAESVRWHKTIALYRPTVAGIALALHDRIKHGRSGRRTIRYVDPRAGRNL